MKKLLLLVVSLSSCISAVGQSEPPRPHILGIAEVRFFSTDLPAARSFYTQTLSAKETSHNAFLLNPRQTISLFSAPSTVPPNLLAEVVFETDDLRELLTYLKAKKIEVDPNLVMVQRWDMIRPGYSTLSVTDPEGHRTSFIQRNKPPRPQPPVPTALPAATQRIIHAGFVVHDRAAMDRFYKDILGFHLYWQGGMHDGETDWVDMQVPDGTDWIEYMLNVPSNASHKTLGVMNHIALGVPDIHAAQQQLIKDGWKGTEQPKIGRDGKWQLNLYDPDGTRVELMEFTPVEKPCCSEYTGPHPKP
jgi:catechol 2,3-dioxygenase-like lactoylglutathione lyase family enzyme